MNTLGRRAWACRWSLAAAVTGVSALAGCAREAGNPPSFSTTLGLDSGVLDLDLDGIYFETTAGRTELPPLAPADGVSTGAFANQVALADGRIVRLVVTPDGDNFSVALSAVPDDDILRWGFATGAEPDEYFTGLMDRVVDGPQQASWAPGITEAMNLRDQQVDMLVKPTTALYAPFYLSSRGYAVFVEGSWPGRFDFASTDPARVTVDFEGPGLAFTVYTADDPATLVRAHALDAGPPVLPPEWAYGPWRWRDEHHQRETYYDGTPVTGPFNSEVMEDVLMMQAYGIPNAVYWIDRPWGPGPIGYDDFEIDAERLPHFADMVRWLDSLGARTVLWIGPFVRGDMATEAIDRGFGLPGQTPTPNGQNYPLIDFSNPAARKFWEDGVAKLLDLGVTGFKLDRSEENLPEDESLRLFDGQSIREARNDYPVMYVEATDEVSRERLGDDFVLMPRAGYTGSSRYGVFWGGDIGGTQEGLRASIIAVQRAAVMGYPNWGSDTCGYNEQLMEQEVCGRWLAFSALTPIMEVGPTRDVGFWNAPRPPEYDATLIALWRLYARLHERLADYSSKLAEEAHETGMPIVRPLFLVDPEAPAAWTNWWTYEYGPDLVVSPVWEKGVREQAVYLPAGARWRDAWNADTVFEGGQTVTAAAAPYQLPLFVRVGSTLDIGDLNREWQEAQAVARTPPDLATLERGVTAWFAENGDADTP